MQKSQKGCVITTRENTSFPYSFLIECFQFSIFLITYCQNTILFFFFCIQKGISVLHQFYHIKSICNFMQPSSGLATSTRIQCIGESPSSISQKEQSKYDHVNLGKSTLENKQVAPQRPLNDRQKTVYHELKERDQELI